MTFRKRMPPVGSRPGTLAIPEGSPPPRIHVFDYDPGRCEEADVPDPADLRPYIETRAKTWVDVQGFGDEAKIRAIGSLFDLRDLTLEDATNVPQRAKSEIDSGHHLMIARAPQIDDAGRVEVPQVCLILGRNYLLTFQDRYLGFFDPVRARIRQGIGPIRELGPDYLAYALLDTLVDHYFPIVEHLASELEELEEGINDEPDSELLSRLHQIRRQLVVIRRVGWPQREALRHLANTHSPFVTSEVNVYLRHTEQHAAQIMEAVDSSREMTSGLVDVYLSNVSQRTNDVMKVLTLMASIFIPLTFVAGIYGMNFEYMPELQSRTAYPLVLTVMVGIAVGMVSFFWYKGWLGRSRRR